jgi:hypothetical protein
MCFAPCLDKRGRGGKRTNKVYGYEMLLLVKIVDQAPTHELRPQLDIPFYLMRKYFYPERGGHEKLEVDKGGIGLDRGV